MKSVRFRRSVGRIKMFFGLLCLGIVLSAYWLRPSLFKVSLPGFTLRHLVVEGRHLTSKKELMEAIDLKQDQSIWAKTLPDIKQRIESCPWVRMAIVKRNLPSTVSVRLLEKVPIALWATEGVLKIVDEEGQVVNTEDISDWGTLMRISGPEAPAHVAALKRILDPFQGELPVVRSGVFLRSRRWDIVLDNGMLVKLPEHNIENALKTLITLFPDLEKQEVTSVDLRFTDAILVEKKRP